jgi:hypothetical protein
MKAMARTVAALLLFGISFGYLEAAVVVYLRALMGVHDLFPLVSLDRLGIEIGREAATILMLIGFGIAAGRNFHERMAAFAVAFGLWDVFFYVFLKVLIGWPQSFLTWDILFLIPLPWVGPVLAPVLVSCTLIVCGLIALHRGGVPVRPVHWMAMTAGGLVVILSFVWDFRNITAGGLPNPFNWPLFLAGEALALGGFIFAARNPGYRGSQTPRGS